jgi:hypothetical protein
MSRAGRFISRFWRDPKKKDRILQNYIHHRNLYAKGNGELGFVWELVRPQNMMITWLFIRDVFPGIPLWVLIVGFPLTIAVKLASKWAVGWWWDREAVFQREADWQNERNPFTETVIRKLEQNDGTL